MNTVPGKCSLFLDLRSTDAQSKNRVKAQLLKELENISARFKVEVTHSVITDEEPVMFSANIMSVIERSCRSLKVPFIAVPSRSGHDACTIAGQVKDVGMIFVPSKGGISHHPAEWTDPESILLGAKVLLLSLLDLATSA
jgi:acetylornithine deacetylase/succinyl-diaminopimelate desuccinylase-like protein